MLTEDQLDAIWNRTLEANQAEPAGEANMRALRAVEAAVRADIDREAREALAAASESYRLTSDDFGNFPPHLSIVHSKFGWDASLRSLPGLGHVGMTVGSSATIVEAISKVNVAAKARLAQYRASRGAP